MKKYDLEDFKKIWKETSKEGILNQFYYEHIELEQLKSNWNSLREFVTLKEKPKVFGAKNGKTLELAIDLVFDMVLDKMNELEGKGKNENE